jgi:hypothetical protein
MFGLGAHCFFPKYFGSCLIFRLVVFIIIIVVVELVFLVLFFLLQLIVKLRILNKLVLIVFE